ncbi:NAD(P)H-binding protein [Mycobacterium sp. AMU20-3851]|uniref:NAD(P)-dependent oxidoreductase n=1 Tax=Mycobacterium sp. AMU20-3851 TaxID=3122055 RepID=UPI0037553DEC
MIIAVLGASGPTGRLLIDRLLADGHDATALVRRPDRFPTAGQRLRVVSGDATSLPDVSAAIAGADAVVSVLGTTFSRKPIDLYSASAQAICAAMTEKCMSWLIVTSSAALSDWTDPGWSWAERTLARPILDRIGRTLYADMARMESIVRATTLDWTIMRPLGLANLTPPTTYQIAEDHVAGRQTARGDLASAIVDQLASNEFSRKTAAVATVDKHQGLVRTIWREGIVRG